MLRRRYRKGRSRLLISASKLCLDIISYFNHFTSREIYRYMTHTAIYRPRSQPNVHNRRARLAAIPAVGPGFSCQVFFWLAFLLTLQVLGTNTISTSTIIDLHTTKNQASCASTRLRPYACSIQNKKHTNAVNFLPG